MTLYPSSEILDTKAKHHRNYSVKFNYIAVTADTITEAFKH